MDTQHESFAFITADEFRDSLESDYGEMRQAAENGAWKSVHVLAGSIVEAVLLDYLISHGHVPEATGLKMDLGSAISECQKLGILSQRSVELSAVLKSFRNLIHPGRLIRLKETVDENSALVARALLRMIVAEIAEQKRRTYGITATQIISKIEKDPSSIGILRALLSEAPAPEIRKLLISEIPDAHEEFGFFPAGSHVTGALEHCFRAALDLAPVEVKQEVCERFLRIVKEDAEDVVLAYETAFFRCSDLAYLKDQGRELVKQHLFHRLKSDSSPAFLAVFAGISDHMTEGDVWPFVDGFVRAVLTGQEEKVSVARALIDQEYWNLPDLNVESMFLQRIDGWITSLEPSKDTRGDQLILLRQIRGELTLPF